MASGINYPFELGLSTPARSHIFKDTFGREEMITQKEIKEIASYDKETGIFTRLTRPCNSVNIGDELGYLKKCKSGLMYLSTEYKGHQYLLHRLAFLDVDGKFPDGDVDHKDGNGLNNKWNNLRVVDAIENGKNRKLNHNNESGYQGVSFYNLTKKWRAAISVDGKKKHLGYFDTFEEAKERRVIAEKEFNYHENHGRK